MYQIFENLCLVVGLVSISTIVFSLINRFIVFPVKPYDRYGGGWALVTGGSDGIGLSFCEELARDGFNIIMVARNRTKMIDACLKLQSQFQIKTRTIIADFSMCLKQDGFYEKILKQIQDLDISILVNNVGVLLETQPYKDHPLQKIQQQCTINMFPISMLTRYIMPLMMIRHQKTSKRGLIINLSSFISGYPAKNTANYSSTKLFDDFLSRSIRNEHKDKIDFLSLRPALVTSLMTRKTDSFLHASPKQCVQGALKRVGKRNHCYGHWSHQLQAWLSQIFGKQASTIIIASSQIKMGQLYKKIDQQTNRN